VHVMRSLTVFVFTSALKSKGKNHMPNISSTLNRSSASPVEPAACLFRRRARKAGSMKQSARSQKRYSTADNDTAGN